MWIIAQKKSKMKCINLITHQPFPITHHPSPISYQPSIISHQPSSTNNQQPNTYHIPVTTYHGVQRIVIFPSKINRNWFMGHASVQIGIVCEYQNRLIGIGIIFVRQELIVFFLYLRFFFFLFFSLFLIYFLYIFFIIKLTWLTKPLWDIFISYVHIENKYNIFVNTLKNICK